MQCELAHYDQIAAVISQGAVHFPFVIGKNPQRCDFCGEPMNVVESIDSLDSEQHEQALTDGGNHLSFDHHRGFCHPLDHCTHEPMMAGLVG